MVTIKVRKFETCEELYYVGAITGDTYQALAIANLFDLDAMVGCVVNSFRFAGVECELEFDGVPEWMESLCRARVRFEYSAE